MKSGKQIFFIVCISSILIVVAFLSHPRIRDIPFDYKGIQKKHFKKNTLSIEFVTAVSVGIPISIFLVIFQKLRINLEKIIQFLIVFLATHLVVTAIVENLKNIVGRFRPDFIERCKPFYKICTGNKKIISDGRKSFPSGHSATCAVGFFYLFMFLHSNYVIPVSFLQSHKKYINFLIDVFILSIPTVVNFTRYIDHKHFLTDVIVGDLIGGITATFFFHKYGEKLLIADQN